MHTTPLGLGKSPRGSLHWRFQSSTQGGAAVRIVAVGRFLRGLVVARCGLYDKPLIPAVCPTDLWSLPHVDASRQYSAA